MAYTKGYRGYGNYYRRPRYNQARYAVSGIKRSQIPTKLTRSEVAKIAKRTLERNVECKYFDRTYSSSLTNNAWYVSNLFAAFFQNVASSGHIGREITTKALRIRVRWAVDSPNLAGSASGATYRLMVFKTSRQFTTTTSAAVLQEDIFRTASTIFDPTLMPDKDTVDVLFDRTTSINPQTAGPGNGNNAFWNIYIPHKRKLHFLEETDVYTKEDNYYAFFAMQRDNGTLTTSGFINLTWQWEYMDA